MKRNYLLLTPGPLSTSETVREAMLQDWCTWDKDYNEGIVTPLRKDLLAIAGLNEDEYTNVLLQGSGTYCVEATIGAAVRPEDKLLILANGAYGKRDGRNRPLLSHRLCTRFSQRNRIDHRRDSP